jgi:hypothetical protein
VDTAKDVIYSSSAFFVFVRISRPAETLSLGRNVSSFALQKRATEQGVTSQHEMRATGDSSKYDLVKQGR